MASKKTILLLFVCLILGSTAWAKPKAPKVDAFWQSGFGPEIDVLSAKWVWLRAFEGTKSGTPAVRVEVNVDLPDSWLWQGKAENARLFRSSGKKLTVDLVNSSGYIEISFKKSGTTLSRKLYFNIDVDKTTLLPLKKCPKHTIDLTPESDPGRSMFIGYSCRETKTHVLVEFVRSADSEWSYPGKEKKRQPRGISRRFKKNKKGVLESSEIVIFGVFGPKNTDTRFEAAVRRKDKRDEKRVSHIWGSFGARYFSGSRKSDDRQHFAGFRAELKNENRFDNFRTYAEGRLYLEQFARLGDTVDWDLREIYGDWDPYESLKVRAGKQIVLWGRADEINPTNMWVPSRSGLLVKDVPNMQRTGAAMVQVQYQNDLIGTLEADFSPIVIPSDIYVNDTLLDRPGKPRGQDAFSSGLRWDRQWDQVETGVSFFNGISPRGDITVTDRTRITQDFSRQIMVGLDGVVTFGRSGVRWELAKTWINGQNYSVGEKRGELFGVFGFERNWNDGRGRIIVQAIFKTVDDFGERDYSTTVWKNIENLSREYHLQHVESPLIASIKASRKFLEDKLEVELLLMQDANSSSHFLRPKASYSLSDSWKAFIGYEYYGGDDEGVFAVLRKNKLAFLELAYFF